MTGIEVRVIKLLVFASSQRTERSHKSSKSKKMDSTWSLPKKQLYIRNTAFASIRLWLVKLDSELSSSRLSDNPSVLL